MATLLPIHEQPAHPIDDALNRLQRGLVAYISYLEACGMASSFSEYVLYEPALRILSHRGFTVICEYPCPNIVQPTKGDKKKLDFYAVHQLHGIEIALEFKWFKKANVDVSGDTAKLQAFRQDPARVGARSFLLAFGTHHVVDAMTLGSPYIKIRSLKNAYLNQTNFACQTYECQ